MELTQLLTSIPVYGNTFDVSINWIGRIIKWLCEIGAGVGVGIILFSLVLKMITLPFDVYQRISMRKQNFQMKANQEKMERLQKQYANDKEKYNQKLMEMYKENGISMMSSCLPMILSLIIFIVAINAFNAFAQYSNIQNYNSMVNAYNQSIERYCPDLTEENVTETADANGFKYTLKGDDADDYFYFEAVSQTAVPVGSRVSFFENSVDKVYLIDVEKVKASALWTGGTIQVTDKTEGATEAEKQANAIRAYFIEEGQKAVADVYQSDVKENTKFLWIKNIWVTDASYKAPVLSYKDFEAEAKREDFKVGDSEVEYSSISQYTNAYSESAYDLVTAKLDQQKSASNGYYVLIVLSIGTILLQQFVTMRSQKEQQKYSTVDGQGAGQQKMMMIIMTGMFAIFSFMYSSAFSIYLTVSNVFSMLSTFVINKFVDKKMSKKEQELEQARYSNNTLSRIEKARQAGKDSADKNRKN